MKDRAKVRRLVFPYIRWVLVMLALLLPFPSSATPLAQEETGQCDTLYDGGKALYDEAQYDAARDMLKSALDCYQDAGDRVGEAKSLKVIGSTYGFQELYDEARAYFERALVLYEQLGDVTEQVKVLTNIGITYHDQEDQKNVSQALAYYEQAIALAHTETIEETTSLSTALVRAGHIHNEQGEPEKSLEYLLQSLPFIDADDEPANQATVRGAIASAYESLGDWQQAIAYAEQSARLYQIAGEPANQATMLGYAAVLSSQYGQYAKAMTYLQQELAIWKAEGNRELQAVTLNFMGMAAENMGNLQDALQFRTQALELMQEAGNVPGIAETLRYKGMLYISLNDPERARFYLNQALEAWKSTDDSLTKTLDIAELYDVIGLTYIDEDDYGTAREYYEKSRQLWESANRPEEQALVLDRIAFTYHSEENYEQALANYEEALSLCQKSDDSFYNTFHVAGILRDISLVNFYMGNTEEAKAALEQAIEYIENLELRSSRAFMYHGVGVLYEHFAEYQSALEYYRRALEMYEEVGDQPGEASMLESLGRLYEMQGEQQHALDLYMESIGIQERIRESTTIEEVKTSFAETYTFVDVYQEAIFLSVQLDRPAEAFNLSERARARTFLDQMGNAQIDVLEGADAALLQQEQELHVALANLRRQLQSESNDMIADNLRQEIVTMQQEYEDLLTTIKLKSPEYASLVSVSTLQFDEVQQLLDNDTTLVSYYIGPEHSLAFVLTRDSFHTVELATDSEELATPVRILRSASSNQTSLPIEATTLYDALIKPLEEYLATPHLAIIPHGMLHYLPFAALSPDGSRYLIDDYILTLLPSASVLPFIQENTLGKSDTMLILGNPDGSLYHTEDEAQAIASMYGMEPLLGEAATEASLHEQATEVGVLHLAAHGQFNTANPLYSAIELAPGGDEDGRLEVHEVYSLDLQQADMVVLSACETNLPHLGAGAAVSGGDELVGLTRAFFYAGTPTVVSTLWQVDDASTALLMERFYIHYRNRMGKAAALRQAQMDVREKYPHFRYWAGVVLSGDSGEVPVISDGGDDTATMATARQTAAPAVSEATESAPTIPSASGGGSGGGSCLNVGFIVVVGMMVYLANHRLRHRSNR